MIRPASSPDRLPVGLCVFGLTYHCGLTWSGSVKANPTPLSAEQLIDLAASNGLRHLELPAAMLGGTSAERMSILRSRAEQAGISFVIAGELAQAESLLTNLKLARTLGAPVVRCILSRILCGDRRGYPGGWKAHLDHCAAEIGRVLPEAERLGIAIAVENHQDADSEDLLALCRKFESRYLGVTLDCGNPLAVMEDPVEFATRVAPYLRHAHLKDYTVHMAPNGFRLVRAALGDGVVDFPALFQVFAEQEWPITLSIEMAALQARLIPMLEKSWWEEFPSRNLDSSLSALQLAWGHAIPATEDWRTPFERDANPSELAALETLQLERSVAYLQKLRSDQFL